MATVVVPVIAATLFTAGGYAVTRAGRNAEVIGDWLFAVLVMTSLGTAAAFASQAMERHYRVPQATRDAMLPTQAVIPPGQA